MEEMEELILLENQWVVQGIKGNIILNELSIFLYNLLYEITFKTRNCKIQKNLILDGIHQVTLIYKSIKYLCFIKIIGAIMFAFNYELP